MEGKQDMFSAQNIHQFSGTAVTLLPIFSLHVVFFSFSEIWYLMLFDL